MGNARNKKGTITINEQFEVIGNTYKYKDVLKLIYNAKWNSDKSMVCIKRKCKSNLYGVRNVR